MSFQQPHWKIIFLWDFQKADTLLINIRRFWCCSALKINLCLCQQQIWQLCAPCCRKTMSLFRAPNQALAMKWGPMSIDLNGKPIIRRITVTTSCHHFVPRTTTEVSRIFVQIFMAGYGPLQGILRADKPSAELFLLPLLILSGC